MPEGPFYGSTGAGELRFTRQCGVRRWCLIGRVGAPFSAVEARLRRKSSTAPIHTTVAAGTGSHFTCVRGLIVVVCAGTEANSDRLHLASAVGASS